MMRPSIAHLLAESINQGNGNYTMSVLSKNTVTMQFPKVIVCTLGVFLAQDLVWRVTGTCRQDYIYTTDNQLKQIVNKDLWQKKMAARSRKPGRPIAERKGTVSYTHLTLPTKVNV